MPGGEALEPVLLDGGDAEGVLGDAEAADVRAGVAGRHRQGDGDGLEKRNNTNFKKGLESRRAFVKLI